MSDIEYEVVRPDPAEVKDNLPVIAQTIQMIERVALSPDADIEKLERVMALQERMMDRDQEAQFNRAMVTAQQNMPIIETKSPNKQTHSLYAKLDAINKEIVPVYTANGFAVSFNTAASELPEHIKIVACVSHSAGHSKTFYHDLPIDDKGMKGEKNKTLMHGRASTVSYGQRYLLTMIFNVSTGTDIDGNQPPKVAEFITEEQQADITALLDETGTDLKRYLKHINRGALSEIPVKDYSKVVAGLEGARK